MEGINTSIILVKSLQHDIFYSAKHTIKKEWRVKENGCILIDCVLEVLSNTLGSLLHLMRKQKKKKKSK